MNVEQWPIEGEFTLYPDGSLVMRTYEGNDDSITVKMEFDYGGLHITASELSLKVNHTVNMNSLDGNPKLLYLIIREMIRELVDGDF